MFLAALSSSRSLVVRPSIRPSVRPSVTFMKKWLIEYKIVTKTYLPSDSSDSSDISDINDFSDSSDSSD